MIAVVIVNWNGRRLLDSCLEAVAAQTVPADLVIVVDNGSADHSVAHLRNRWPTVEVLELGHNLGVAAGNNAGIGRALAAGADHVLLLNNDAIMRPDVLELLSSTLGTGARDVWAVTPKIVYRSDPATIWSAGGEMIWWKGLARDRGNDQPDLGQYDRDELVSYANTCCLLIKAEAFAKAGLMDEAYFMYFDDSDFCGRLLRAGGKIAYAPRAVVLHDVQASSKGAGQPVNHFMVYYTTRNRVRFIQRNVPGAPLRALAHLFTITSRLVRMAQALGKGDRRTSSIIWRAIFDGYVRRLTGPTYTP
ncbi:MAG TPA: glycosyltransferase family 2 protein [Gemmatimonadales bacterium]|nr:glycosyltransferase family 2 protein [Gemmatimonadales bacterium]